MVGIATITAIVTGKFPRAGKDAGAPGIRPAGLRRGKCPWPAGELFPRLRDSIAMNHLKFLLPLGLLAAVAGCGDKPVAGPQATANYPLPEPPLVAKCEPGQFGGRLVIATFGDPKSFNPITANEGSSQDIYRFVFSGLTTLDEETQVVGPSLAESWSVEPDQKTWTFKLRRGLRWNDGQPLTAADVAFTWNDVIYNPQINNVTRDLFMIDGKNFMVTNVDEVTVRVVTPDVYAPFLEAFGAVPILPKHVLNRVPAGKFGSAYGIDTPPGQIVGSGPFRIKKFKPAEFTLLERNPYYYAVDQKGQRLPYLDNVIYTVVPDMNTMSERFIAGECDVLEMVRPDEYERYKTESAKGRFHLHDLGLGLERGFFWFNQNTNQMANVQITSDPPGAEITWHNISVGQLPQQKKVTLGGAEVTVKFPGAAEERKTIALSSGQALPAIFQFTAGKLEIHRDLAGGAAVLGVPIVEPKKLKWFRDVKFRQALSYAVDRPSIIKSIYAGRARPNYGIETEGNKKWYNSAIATYPFDLEKARAILAEIGIKDRNGDGLLEDADGHKIEFVLNTNTGNNVREKIALLVQADLKKLGISLIFQPVEFNSIITRVDSSYDYDAILLSLGGGGIDPISSMNVLKSDWFTHQWFPRQRWPATDWEARIDFLMNAQVKTLDFAARKKIFDEVQAIMAEQVPMIYTVTPVSYCAVKANIANTRPTVLSYYRATWNVEELYLKKK